MNLLSNWKQKDLSLPDKHILPFYPLSDLDEVSDEITIDKFEEYADYRVKCMCYWVGDSVSSIPKDRQERNLVGCKKGRRSENT